MLTLTKTNGLTLDHSLKELCARRIAEGLKRKTITTCSKWALNYRVMPPPFPGNWTFDHHPWLREMHDCDCETMVGQKAAQMGYTETALNKVFFGMDVKNLSAMYVLPAAKPDASDFSSARFDPALELSPHLERMFSNVKNVGHKRAGSANLYIRGSRSRTQLKSVGTAIMIFDELDEMVQKNVTLGEERASGQLEETVQLFYLSTATIEKYGINEMFGVSTQEHYYFKCPHCGRMTELIFPECLVITADNVSDTKVKESHLICKECKVKLEHAEKMRWLSDHVAGGTGRWIPTFKDRMSRGFQISQLYSMVVPPWKIAISRIKADTNPSDEQEFYNSKLGVTHTVEGAKLSIKNLEDCIGTHKKSMSARTDVLTTMGVDVGKWLHIEIDQWFLKEGPGADINLLAQARLLWEGKVQNFEELDNFMRDFQINFCVIDANPERRKALEFAQRFWGHVRLCFYGNNVTGKTITLKPEEEHTMTVDRTTWLDLSLGRVRRKAISYPVDLSMEYKDHLQAPVRIYRKDKDENPIGLYVTGNEADHFAHARNYAELALPLAASLMTSQDIRNIL